MKSHPIPGVSLLILKNDAVVKSAAYGSADLERHAAAKPDQVYEAGSITKSFTAVVVMQLVGEGKISLSDPVGKYILQAPASWGQVTLERLITHTSGLPDYALVPGIQLTDQWTDDQWFAKIVTVPLDFPTGTSWGYSNTNFRLLGFVVQKVCGKDYQAVVADRIFKPLGLTHTRFGSDSDVIDNRSVGYFHTPEGIMNRPGITLGVGDGGIVTNCEDLAKFERGLRQGKLLPLNVVSKMQTPARLANGRQAPYGYGWFVRDSYGIHVVSHGGNTAGYSASISRWTKSGLTVAVMCNVHDISGDDFARKIAEAYDPSLAAVVKESPDPDPARSGKLKAALIALAGGDVNQDAFDPEMTARLATGRGRMAVNALKPFTRIESFAYLHEEPNDPDRIVRYRVRAGGKSNIVAFVVTTAGKIYSIIARQE